ncbi:MAG: type II toxin-antitoxin system prevent-host-death family antitoxin [Alkalibacterium sp.]|nr:type II toxin-antitoxin system prevent-host-death family antitoxin [Alkalibacterium sp.]
MEIMTPTNFRKDMFNVMKKVSENNTPLEVTLSSKEGLNDGIVLLSKKEYERMQEELYLERTGTMDYVQNAMDTATEDDFEEV